MASSTLRALLSASALAAVAAGMLVAVADLQHVAPDFMDPDIKFSEHVQKPLWLAHGVTHILATTILLFALPGLLAVQGDRMPRWGIYAFFAAFPLLATYLGVSYVMTLGAPDMPAEVIDGEATGAMAVAFLSFPLSYLALAACAAATMRAGVLPRWAAVTFGAGALLTPVTEMLSGAILLPVTGALVMGVGLCGLGLAARRLARGVGSASTMPRSAPPPSTLP